MRVYNHPLFTCKLCGEKVRGEMGILYHMKEHKEKEAKDEKSKARNKEGKQSDTGK